MAISYTNPEKLNDVPSNKQSILSAKSSTTSQSTIIGYVNADGKRIFL